MRSILANLFFFFNDTATTEIYTLSLHDALPISVGPKAKRVLTESRFLMGSRIIRNASCTIRSLTEGMPSGDRKSTRLNSSHDQISYAVFCLKKKTLYSTARLDSVGVSRA